MLQHGKYYHVYNRGNNREDLFKVPDNYLHFLKLYEKYISPIADTYAWVLMRNHFHLLVRIKDEEEIRFYSQSKNSDREKAHCQDSASPLSAVENPDRGLLKKPNPTRQFSHLFNAYAQSINRAYNRTGALFQRPFKYIQVDSDHYFRQLIMYIHTNPVHHGFTDNFKDYPWSSYGTILSVKPTRLSKEKVLGWFNDRANFIEVHNSKANFEVIKNLIVE